MGFEWLARRTISWPLRVGVKLSRGTWRRRSRQPQNTGLRVFVVISCANLCQVFAQNGKFLRKFGSEGDANGQLRLPYGLCVDAADNWSVCDSDNDRVQIFQANGRFLTTFGFGEGDEPSLADRLYSICVDLDGRIFVSATNNVQVFAFEHSF